MQAEVETRRGEEKSWMGVVVCRECKRNGMCQGGGVSVKSERVIGREGFAYTLPTDFILQDNLTQGPAQRLPFRVQDFSGENCQNF